MGHILSSFISHPSGNFSSLKMLILPPETLGISQFMCVRLKKKIWLKQAGDFILIISVLPAIRQSQVQIHVSTKRFSLKHMGSHIISKLAN